MKNTLLIFRLSTPIFLMTLFPLEAFSTFQGPDIFIWEKDTLYTYSNPLESHPNMDDLKGNLFGEQGCWSTAYWRGYKAEWTLIDKELFLTNIYSPCHSDDTVKADLANLFPQRYKNRKVKADWMSDELWIPKGTFIHGYLGLYMYEIRLSFENGILTDIKEYDNSESQKSIYTQNSDSLFQFIYSHINWKALPDSIAGSNKVSISFQANELGRINHVKIKRANNIDLIREAVRVVKLIPQWDVYYKRGKFFPMSWTYLIVFSEENRQKYTKSSHIQLK